ncbi:MAG: hypothetical protein M1835_001340 [Candelina submexicana]|nr:MAG: hypothetical protein M1835_001340 [Candelina submexicana]
MASYQIFNDLPRIYVDENGPLHEVYGWSPFEGNLENHWNPEQALKAPSRIVSTGYQLTSSNVQVSTNLQRFLLDPESDAYSRQPTSGQYGLRGLKTFTTQQDLFPPYEPQSPYPLVDAQRRFGSPTGSWRDEGSATELTSSSACSDWSPRSSTGDIHSGGLRGLEPQAGYYHDRDLIIQRQEMHLHAGYESTVEQPPLLGRSKSDSCVALREVQQYPDSVEPEETHDEGFDGDVKMGFHFAQGKDRSLKIDCSGGDAQQHLDERFGSSIQDEFVEVEPSVADAGEEEDYSDYTPSPRKKRRQSSQTGTTSPMSPAKRSPRHRRTSQNGTSKVTKRCSSPKPCSHMKRMFKNATEHKKHSKANNLRPFACTLTQYGCPSTFGSKNEWKRHVSSQHLSLGFWRCDQGSCTQDPSRPNDFNRKDLFTQHLRRMHAPASPKSPPSTVAATRKAQFEASLDNVRQRCFVVRRMPPKRSLCEVCGKVFEGEGSWEERMEHVGRHYEHGQAEGMKGSGERYVDKELRKWLLAEGLLEGYGKGWRLVDGKSEIVVRKGSADGSDLDAEAEDE